MFSIDGIRIASPCKSDWDKMYGDDRRRFCSECSLNVYNLSDMSREEAERLVMNSEGRLCVRFFRRKDGTILTQDCPVGWKAIKHRVSRTAVALSTILAGFFAGLLSLRAVDSAISLMPTGEVAPPAIQVAEETELIDGLVEQRGRVVYRKVPRPTQAMVGRVDELEGFPNMKVKAWVK